MHKLPIVIPKTGAHVETDSTKLSPICGPTTTPFANEKAAAAAGRLFDWCRMPDVGDSKVYLAGVVAILAEYPAEVMEQIADPRTGTRVLGDYPSLATIRKACEILFAPIARKIERQKAHASHAAALPRPKRTPEQQARIDAQVARVARERAEAAISTTGPPS